MIIKFFKKVTPIHIKKIIIKYGPIFIGQRYYGKWFFDAINENSLKSNPLIAHTIIKIFHPKFVIDFGCGNGELLYWLKKYGVKGLGTEYSETGIKLANEKGIKVERLDFSKRIIPNLDRGADLAVCLEVAEHLFSKDSDFMIECITATSAKTLFFTAARKGQGGEGHLNEQPVGYWKRKIEKLGWKKNIKLTKKIADIFNKSPMPRFYSGNIQIFER